METATTRTLGALTAALVALLVCIPAHGQSSDEELEEELSTLADDDFPDLVAANDLGELADELAFLQDDNMVELAARHRQEIGMSPSAVWVITREEIETSGASTIPDLLRRREELGMKLIPLLIHDCPWKAVRWLRALNIVPDKATPLDTMSEQEQDSFLARMTEDIGKFLETWQEPEEPAEAVVATAAPTAIPWPRSRSACARYAPSWETASRASPWPPPPSVLLAWPARQ